MTHRDKTEDMEQAERHGFADGYGVPLRQRVIPPSGSVSHSRTQVVRTANELWAYDLGKRLGWHMSRVR